MALTLDRSVLEKIEALQNIMLASVTGGARDEAEYRQIREELLRLPGLKDAPAPLRSHAATCRSYGTSSKPRRSLAAMHCERGTPDSPMKVSPMHRLALEAPDLGVCNSPSRSRIPL
jgi:hypothetical protein